MYCGTGLPMYCGTGAGRRARSDVDSSAQTQSRSTSQIALLSELPKHMYVSLVICLLYLKVHLTTRIVLIYIRVVAELAAKYIIVL
jgi:hypothetical protein